MKRKNTNSHTDSTKRRKTTTTEHITPEFIKKCKTEFEQDPMNIMARNAVTCVGSFNASTKQSFTLSIINLRLANAYLTQYSISDI